MMKTKDPALVGKWYCNYHVKTVATLSEDQASEVLFGNTKKDPYDTWFQYAAKPLKVTIDYPLRKPVTFTLKPKTQKFYDGKNQTNWCFGTFLWQVARKYVEIYQDPVKHQVWGHDISDLIFEAVIVKKNGTAELSIGS